MKSIKGVENKMANRLIEWNKDAITVKVTREKWNALIDAYRANRDFEEVKNVNDERRFRFVYWFGKFQISTKDKKYPVLYVGTPAGDLFRFIVNAVDDEKNAPHVGGYEAYKIVSREFRKNNLVGIDTVFGKVEPWFKKFVKPAIIEINPRYALQNNYGTYKADFSSAYPAASCGILPDAHTAITIKGRIKPSQEYPFAFYKKSGHLAEYGRYSSIEWLKTFYGKYIMLHDGQTVKDEYDSKTIKLNPDDDETILMKAAGYGLTKTMHALYNRKGESENIKQAMVAFFGFCQSIKFNRGKQAHIVAVVYARHIQKMIETTAALKEAGCVPLMYATDSIAWRGKPPEGLCADQKKIGAFVLEYKNAVLRYKACGVYALQDLKTGDIYLIKHQGVKMTEGQKIERLRDIDKLSLNITEIDDTGKIVERDLEYGTKKQL